ncbi:hypothetical protein GW777_05820 [Candidatus Peregrinibacteria bacterium]|nr:hypothetical protein [bacterium]NCQ55804.1 hypothetical protein [Candidatus Parcubacteria bacterium]NCS67871.1 hypothetical protein [Candidatus Peregrinibacteria bacterium]
MSQAKNTRIPGKLTLQPGAKPPCATDRELWCLPGQRVVAVVRLTHKPSKRKYYKPHEVLMVSAGS